MDKSKDFDRIAKKISEMTVVQLNEFRKTIQKAFHIGEENNEELPQNKEYDDLINEITSMSMKQGGDLIQYIADSLGLKLAASFEAGKGEEEDQPKAAEKNKYQVFIQNFKLTDAEKVKFIQTLRAHKSDLTISTALPIYQAVSGEANKNKEQLIFDGLDKDKAMAFKAAIEPFVEVVLK